MSLNQQNPLKFFFMTEKNVQKSIENENFKRFFLYGEAASPFELIGGPINEKGSTIMDEDNSTPYLTIEQEEENDEDIWFVSSVEQEANMIDFALILEEWALDEK